MLGADGTGGGATAADLPQKVRLDCLFVRRPRWPGPTTSRPRPAGGAHPRDAGAAAGGDGRAAWSSAASPARRPRWSPSGPGSAAGAQLHHFPTKNDLVVAAVEHLTELRGAELAPAAGAAAARRAAHPRGARRCSATTSPRRSSPPRSSCGSRPAPTRRCCAAVGPLEQRVGRETHRLTVERARRRRVAARRPRAGAGHPRPGARPRAGQHDHRRRPAAARRILDRWADVLDDASSEAGDERPARRACSPTSTAEGDRLWRHWSSGLDEDGWRTPTPAAGWDVATQVAHLAWTDEVGACSRRPTRRPGTRSCCEAIDDPDGFVDTQAARRSPRPTPAALLARWRTARDGAGRRRCARYPDGQRMPWFGPPMSADLDGDRAVHGDLGARASTCTRRSASRPRSPTGSGTSPTSASAPATSPSPCTGSSAPAEEFRVDLVAPSGEVWAWGPEDAAQTVHRLGATTSACWSPSASTAPTPTWSPPAPTPTAGSTSRSASPARRARGGRRDDGAASDRQLLRLLRRPALARCARCWRAGRLDVLTGDYLAELTMLILGRDQHEGPVARATRGPSSASSRTASASRSSAASGSSATPAASTRPGLADRLREVAPRARPRPGDRARRGRRPARRSARSRARSPPTPTSAGSASPPRSRAGADVVVTGRVTDASLVVGPAVAHHGWAPTSYDELAGAVVAGHVLECGTQATGGNFSGLRRPCPDDAPGRWASRSPRSPPTARSVITKHDGTGGAVTVDTVTAQLIYEIQSHALPRPRRHHRPRHDPARAGRARTGSRSRGVRGEAPPERLKVCVNELGGFRNTVEFVLTGLDIEAKADVGARAARRPPLTARRRSTWTLGRAAAARRRHRGGARPACCAARSRTRRPTRSGRAFTGRRGRAGAGVLPRLHDDRAARRRPTPYGVYRAGVRRPRGRSPTPSSTPTAAARWSPTRPSSRAAPTTGRGRRPVAVPRAPRDIAHPPDAARHVRARPLRRQGRRRQPRALGRPRRRRRRSTTRGSTWLAKLITPDARSASWCPRRADLDVEVLRAAQPRRGQRASSAGCSAQGVAASTRFDPQAKGAGRVGALAAGRDRGGAAVNGHRPP